MGCFDQHLWEFTIAKQSYGAPMDEDWGTALRRDAAKVRLYDVLKPRKTTIDYLYDFGDSWELRLIVSGLRQGDPAIEYPRYIGGEWNAPPRIAAAFPASMRRSTRSPTPPLPTPPTRSSGTRTTIPRQSTHWDSNTRLAESPSGAMPPLRAS
jgi:Plasmid pRiA4b ORF-3-like protein